MIVIAYSDVRKILAEREDELILAVRSAYLRHAEQQTSLPKSVFLRFPERERDRIIALPAYLGGEPAVAGIKWIASFPGNIELGLQRASAVIVLNSTTTGRPEVLMEASVISAQRTAASAALAARRLAAAPDEAGISLIGCGVINFEVLRFVSTLYPALTSVTVHDLEPSRAGAFARRCGDELGDLKISIVPDLPAAVAEHTLLSIATTSSQPYLDTNLLLPGSLVLHVSLRDVLIDSILGNVNVVDDREHVCQASTSVHLAEQRSGNRDFIDASIGELLLDEGRQIRDPRRTTIFSPFGLGILDLAVAELVWSAARREGVGVTVPDFLPGEAS